MRTPPVAFGHQAGSLQRFLHPPIRQPGVAVLLQLLAPSPQVESRCQRRARSHIALNDDDLHRLRVPGALTHQAILILAWRSIFQPENIPRCFSPETPSGPGPLIRQEICHSPIFERISNFPLRWLLRNSFSLFPIVRHVLELNHSPA